MSGITRNQLIHKIKAYLPNEKIQLKKHEITGDLQIIFTNKKLKTEVKKGSIIQEGYNPKFYRLCKKTNMEKNKKFFSKFDVIEDFQITKYKTNKFFKS